MTAIPIEQWHNTANGIDAFVVANGPSSGMVEPDKVRKFGMDKIVIGCNDVWRVLRGEPLECDFFVMLDMKFNEDHYKEIRDYLRIRPNTMPITFFPMEVGHTRIPINMQIDSQLQFRHEIPEPFKPNQYFHGHSSGVAAIQFAMQMGCRRIYLLGHDLTITHKRTHGFGDRSRERNNGYQQGLTMRSGYDLITQHAKQIGTEIINLSMVSSLDQFPKHKEFMYAQASPKSQIETGQG